MFAVFRFASLGNPPQASMTTLPEPPELDRLTSSSPLIPEYAWQDCGQDFRLLEQQDETISAQQSPAVEGSTLADRYNNFTWPVPAISPSMAAPEDPHESSLDGISPRSKVHRSGTEFEVGASHAGANVDQLGGAGETARVDSIASTKDLTEKDLAGFEVRRRAKNRIAAGKSRAKSKRHHEALQERYEQSLDQNSALKHQEQSLRVTAAFLKDCLLQHNSSSCSCKCLHQFNTLRAENIARGIVSPGGMLT